MIHKEKLYEAFGEMIYAVAKADGLVQAEEISTLKKVLQGHLWAKDIQWSFDYESQKQHSPEMLYQKALDVFVNHGPDPDYAYLIEVLEAVAEASAGIDEKEKAMIKGFQEDFKERLIKDLESNKLRIELP